MNNQNPPPPAFVMWIIWIAMLGSVFMIQFTFAGGLPSGEDDGRPPVEFVALSIGVVLAATAIRWFVIPRQKEQAKILVSMVIGLALAESAQFYQLFLIGDNYPRTQLSLFLLAVLGVAQFAPIYGGKRD